MSEAASTAVIPHCDPPSGPVRPGGREAGAVPTDRDRLPVALLLFRLVLERYGDAGPDTTWAMATFDRLQARILAEPEAPVLDRAATVALFSAVNRVRALVQ